MNKAASHMLNHRLKMAALLAVLGTAGIEARLFELQVLKHKEPEGGARNVASKSFVWNAARGLILDRNGRKLVANAEFDTLVAHPKMLAEKEKVASMLEPILGIPPDTLMSRLTYQKPLGSAGVANPQKAVKRRLPADAVRQLRTLNLPEKESDPERKKPSRINPKVEMLDVPGLALLKEPGRYYLKNELAGQAIGWVDIDNIGRGGIELWAEEKLKGTTSTVEARPYGELRSILETDYTRVVPIRGADVVLTLDETIQWIAEKALFSFCEEHEAKGGTAVVLEPQSGEVLAMANYPSFASEKVGEYAANGQMERARNRCITDLFEPGSTMKPFIVAAGLESGAIDPETLIDCENGCRYVPGRDKPIRDVHPVGVVPVTDVLVHSSNVGAGKIAERIVRTESGEFNKKILHDYLIEFGFGDKCGIDLPGESRSVIRPSWQEWTLNDILVLAFGTGPVMVTPIGLARSYCLFANGGFSVTPHAIKGYIGNRDGKLYEEKIPKGEQVLSRETADAISEMLARVVELDQSKARSDWYQVAGKTGTAKKVINGHYSQSHRLLSFAGFAPLKSPKIVVSVMIDEPQGLRYGNEAGAPVFRRIVDDTLAYLHVAPDLEKKELGSDGEDDRLVAAQPIPGTLQETFVEDAGQGERVEW
jgi:cell division protein FtsI (penicillin-binding protein 3)